MNKIFTSYLTKFISFTLISLFFVSILNYFIDPGGIYHGKSITPEKYASSLVKSSNGLLWPEGLMSDRKLAKALIKHSLSFNCVIIGSSHVRPISSARKNRSLTGLCPSILNIAVDGASIEDHITLSYLLIKSGFSNNVILGLDPWTLTYNKDSRWLIYSSDYYISQNQIFNKKKKPINLKNNLPIIFNLIDLEYTLNSISMLNKYFTLGLHTIIEVDSFDHSKGIETAVKLPDGTVISSNKDIRLRKLASKSITINDGILHDYKVDTNVSSLEAIEDYKLLLKWIAKSNAVPHILLTPYHPYAWIKNDSKITLAMLKTERILRSIAKQLEISIYGSYDPSKLNCKKNEFDDIMHPKDVCLAKINVDI